MEQNQEWLDAGFWIGRQQAFALIASKCSAAQAQCLKQVRESKIHEKLGTTWQEFCPEHFGISRPTADRIIQQFDEFGAAYFKLASIARISAADYRELAPSIDAETIRIDGEHVPITQANASRIRAHVASLRSELKAEQIRTIPSLQEFHNRLTNVIRELDNRVGPNMATVDQDFISEICKVGVDQLNKVLKRIAQLSHR